MAQSVIQSLREDFLRCAICKKPFKEPKMLPCLHSFCLLCLRGRTNLGSSKKMSCPTCFCTVELSITGVYELPKNSFLIGLVERLEQMSRLSKEYQDYSCSICRNKTGTTFCLDCKIHFCQDCKKTHDHLTRSSDHQLMQSDKLSDEKYLQNVIYTQTPYCTSHKEEKVRYYCKKCRVLACQVCATVSHRDHNTLQEVESKVSSVKAHMATLLSKSESKASEAKKKYHQINTATAEIQQEILQLHEKIDSRYRELERKLKSHRQKLRDELQMVENAKCEGPKALQSDLSNWLKTLKNTQDMTRKILAQNNPWEILEMEDSITHAVEKLVKEEGKLHSFHRPGLVNLEFCPAVLVVSDSDNVVEGGQSRENTPSEVEMEKNYLGVLKKGKTLPRFRHGFQKAFRNLPF